MNKNCIWLCDSFLKWYAEVQSYHHTSVEDRLRAYRLWQHAELLATGNANEFNRVDIVSNLKRCLNQRLKFIEYVYSLKKIASSDSPKGYLEYLESLGLVRPYMLKKLMLIRNDIEHNDAPPPNIERCRELLDLTWYLLKSTDGFVSLCKNNFILKHLSNDESETQYWLDVDINFNLNHTITIKGWVPEIMLSREEEKNYTLINLEDFSSKKERWERTTNHTDKLDNDFWVSGTLEPSEKIRLEVVKSCLNANI